MKVFFSIFENDIKQVLHDWKTVILLLIMPLLTLVYFSYAVYPILNKNASVEPFNIAIVDMENSIQSKVLIGQLKDLKIIHKAYTLNEIEARNLILDNKIAAAVLIPEGFTGSVASGENKSIAVIGNAKKEQQSLMVKSLITSASNIVSSGQGILYSYYHFVKDTSISQTELNREFDDLSEKVILKSLNRKEVISDINTYPNSNLTPSEYYTAALLAVFFMFSGMPILKMMINERNLGITKRLQTTNVGTFKLILSKFVLSFLLASIQLFVIILGTSKILKNYWGAPLSTILLIFSAGVFAVTCWSLLVSAIATTTKSAELIGNLGILLMALLGGSIYPLSKMPDLLKPVSFITINKWLQEGFMNIFSGDNSPDIWPQASMLVLLGLLFFSLAIAADRLKKGGAVCKD